MKIKDVIKLIYFIIKKARKYDGCILICKAPYIAEATMYGECTVYDLDKYTKDFNNG